MNSQFSGAGTQVDTIDVRINYDIIRLFSEGLYKSPHKAIEELVSNSYDAGAERVHILLPDLDEDSHDVAPPLWVIDDGHGMDKKGFQQLWRIADSNKTDDSPKHKGRPPIGQFGIGKLAAYVLAWNLTHISRAEGDLLLTSMNFQNVDKRSRQADGAEPVSIDLRKIDEIEARTLLSDIKDRDSAAWDMMFGENDRAEAWTAVALSDFKDLYGKLQTGTLRWVLSTGLPLVTDFGIWLNGARIESSKEGRSDILHSVPVNEHISDIGHIKGEAIIHKTPLDRGKSEKIGRSYGFFIRVRGRIINLDDDTFGMSPFNHAAWSRFVMDVKADGLQDHLLSSREGVRDSDAIRAFQECIRAKFNECRNAYEKWNEKTTAELDIQGILSSNETPNTRLIEPLISVLSKSLNAGRNETFYISAPRNISPEDYSEWLGAYEKEISTNPFTETSLNPEGADAPALRYDIETKALIINSNHPFIDKLTRGGKNAESAHLFAYAESLIEGQLLEQGIGWMESANFLRERDHALRMFAGHMAPHTATSISRLLQSANQDATKLELTAGAVFKMLGFEYQRAGGNNPGADGILYARLGRHADKLADYKVVYDAKQTNAPAVPASKIDFDNLAKFASDKDAKYGFFIADSYQGEIEDSSTINSKLKQHQASDVYPTLLKLDHLKKLVRIHYTYGVTLTDIRRMFEKAHTVPEVNAWLEELEERLESLGEVPLQVLLEGLEREKEDTKAVPNVIAVRKAQMQRLDKFEPDQLTARLQAVETIIGRRWIEVDAHSYDVKMHQTSEQILQILDKNVRELRELDR